MFSLSGSPVRPLSTHRPLGQIQSPLFVLAQNKHNKKEQQAGMGLCTPAEYMDDSPMLTYYFLAISLSTHWHLFFPHIFWNPLFSVISRSIRTGVFVVYK